MANSYFQFKQFLITQDRAAMKVTTDSCLFGAWVAAKANGRNVLDIGTGTGLLALMYAQQHDDAMIDCVEIDQETKEEAEQNISASPFGERISVIYGDVKELNVTQQYDLVICNPPFYENELKSPDARRNLAHHQSSLSLEELMNVKQNVLSTEGTFYLLLSMKSALIVDDVAKRAGLFINGKLLVRQTIHHDFFRMILLGGRKKVEGDWTTELSIRDGNSEYTPGFVELLREYYLYL